MAQLFPESFNNLSRISLYGGLLLIAFVVWMAVEYYNSDYVTGVNVAPPQPVELSHRHHVGDDGIDCRYCHTSVEVSSYAGIPSTETCMTCHSVLFSTSPALELVRTSYQTDTSIRWQRVHELPKYVFFHHGIHISKGIGCSSCHGRVDTMPLVWRVATLRMDWCLECHRAPEKFIRPRDQVFNMEWTAPPGGDQQGRQLLRNHGVATSRLTDCFTCHR